MSKQTIWKSMSIGVIAIVMGLAASLSGCAQEDDAWPATKEVVWNAETQQCYHNGLEVNFDDGATYESCLTLAYSVIDGTYQDITPDTVEKIVICSEYCEVDGNGGMRCTGVRCVEY